MRRWIKLAVTTALCGVCAFVYAQDETPAFVQEARQATTAFQQALKKELMSAMQSGGPRKAVAVCHSRAPEIARQISKQTGWEIGRTSLRTRNYNNTPDAMERDVLAQFEERKAGGAAVSRLEWWQEHEDAITYMKAIPMQEMCAGCHGGSVSPSLQQYIRQFYPGDMATGFKVGDIRGAFTLQKYTGPLDE